MPWGGQVRTCRPMKKLNFGCGNRFADGWCNIDFSSHCDQVRRVNLLRGFPFPDATFDAVYSSHVLEHFPPGEGMFLLSESRRVLRPGGIIRIVVPDLENACREYLRILELNDFHPRKEDFYRWIMVELLDQLVRSQPRGEMGPFMDRVASGGDRDLAEYVRLRTENVPQTLRPRQPPPVKMPRLMPQRVFSRLSAKFLATYLKAISFLVPASLRGMIINETTIGERHRWMYDRYGLALAMRDCGFADVSFTDHAHSGIPGFEEDFLDANPDGSPYKNGSLYCEATKA